MAANTTNGRGNTPPYVSYPSFKTLMSELHETSVPSRIDRSVLKRFSGITGTQLMTALRFLKLIDDDNKPSERLRELAAACGTTMWPLKMQEVLQEAYAPLFGLDLGNATASHFDETFRKSFPGADSVVQKCIAFFLGAAKDSGIIISDRVLIGRKTRPANGTPRKPRAAKAANGASNKPSTAKTDETLPPLDPEDQPADFKRDLLAKFPTFDPQWSEDIKAAWFKGFDQFMEMAKK